MPAFLKQLSFTQFMHMCGVGIFTGLFVNGNITQNVAIGAIALLIGIALPNGTVTTETST